MSGPDRTCVCRGYMIQCKQGARIVVFESEDRLSVRLMIEAPGCQPRSAEMTAPQWKALIALGDNYPVRIDVVDEAELVRAVRAARLDVPPSNDAPLPDADEL